MNAFLTGLGLGLFVAAQPGPVTLLVVRTAARSVRLAALMIGLAAACVDALFAALGAAGVAPLLQWEPGRVALGLLGCVVLISIGIRTLLSAWRVRPLKIVETMATARRAFAIGVAATASNPLTIGSWAVIFTAASLNGSVDSFSHAAALVMGIGIASACWFSVLILVSTAAMHRMSIRWLRRLDVVSGVEMVIFGLLLGVRSLLATS